MGWGKRQIPLISPWLASVILQNFEFPHPFPSNSKQCREFSPAQGQRSQFIPLYSPTYSPGWPGVLPQGQAADMCISLQCWPQPQVFRAYFLNSCNIQGNVQAFRLTGLLWWQKTDLTFPAFSLRFVDFTVLFCFRCMFSISFRDIQAWQWRNFSGPITILCYA